MVLHRVAVRGKLKEKEASKQRFTDCKRGAAWVILCVGLTHATKGKRYGLMQWIRGCR